MIVGRTNDNEAKISKEGNEEHNEKQSNVNSDADTVNKIYEINADKEIIDIEMGEQHQIITLLISKNVGIYVDDKEGALQAHKSMGSIFKL